MKISVCKKRKAIIVTNFGHYPFARVEDRHHGICFVPDGFQIEFFSHKMNWIGNIRVKKNEVEYQCISKRNPSKCSSGFHDNPSAAYREANELENNSHYKKSSNGALLFGVTYPNVQNEIRTRFRTLTDDYGLEEEEVVEDNVIIHDQEDSILMPVQESIVDDVLMHDPNDLVYFDDDEFLLSNTTQKDEETPRKRQRGLSACSLELSVNGKNLDMEKLFTSDEFSLDPLNADTYDDYDAL